MLWRYGRLLHPVRTSSWPNRLFSTGGIVGQEQPVLVRKRGRPRKDEQKREVVNVAEISQASIDMPKAPAFELALAKAKSKRRVSNSDKMPPRVLPRPSKHNDLASYVKYASNVNLDLKSNVYKGTLYEYTVASVLQSYNFALERVGQANDKGIDLRGYWHLPSPPKLRPNILPIIVQCKAFAPRPAMIRELEGSYVGAPAGWRDDGVLALLVSSETSTKGVNLALQRSSLPMGLMQVTPQGQLRQFVWNLAAARAGMEGLGVVLKYGEDNARDGEMAKGRVLLTWMGSVWRTGDVGG